MKLYKQMIMPNFAEFGHFMLDLFGEIASLSLKLQAKALILPMAISAIHNCIDTIKSMKEQPIPNGALEQFWVCVEGQKDEATDSSDPLMFQGIEMKGGSSVTSRFGTHSNNTVSQAIVKTVDITVRELTARFQNLLGSNKDENAHDAVSSFRIFHHDTWPNCKRAILEFGIQEIEVLCNWFKTPLLAAGCNIEAVPAEWRQLKVVVSNSFQDKSYSDLWQLLLSKEPYKSDFCNVLHLVELMLVLPISSAECERSFSAQKRIKSDARSSLSVQRLSDLILISSEGPELSDFDPNDSVAKWMSSGRRKPSGAPGQIEWSEDIVSVVQPE